MTEQQSEWAFDDPNRPLEDHHKGHLRDWYDDSRTYSLKMEALYKLVLKISASRSRHLKTWKEEALPVIAGLQELGRVLGMTPGQRITGPEATAQATAIVAERDLYATRLRKIERALGRSLPDERVLGEIRSIMKGAGDE